MSSPTLSRPPFDPSFILATGWPGAPRDLDVSGMRKEFDSATANDVLSKFPNLQHIEHSIPVTPELNPDPITLSIFQTKTTTTTTPRAAILYSHGGGQIVGSRFFGLEHFFSMLPLPNDVILATVEYRLAPEHRAPAQAHDVYAAAVYLFSHAAKLNIDTTRIVTFGVSGGAAPVAAAALMARRTQKVKIAAQVLSVPMIDDRDHYLSYKQFEENTLWPGRMNRQAWNHVLGPDRKEISELEVPARAESLADMPDTFIDVGECEVFRDSAIAFAARILADGGSCELHVWPGMYHVGAMFEPEVEVSKKANAAQVSFFERKLRLDKKKAGSSKPIKQASL